MDDLFAPTHLILIAVIALLIFGPRKLPEIGAGLGRAIREFKDSFAGITNVPADIRNSVRTAGQPPAAAQPAPPAAASPVTETHDGTQDHPAAPASPGRDGTAPPAA